MAFVYISLAGSYGDLTKYCACIGDIIRLARRGSKVNLCLLLYNYHILKIFVLVVDDSYKNLNIQGCSKLGLFVSYMAWIKKKESISLQCTCLQKLFLKYICITAA